MSGSTFHNCLQSLQLVCSSAPVWRSTGKRLQACELGMWLRDSVNEPRSWLQIAEAGAHTKIEGREGLMTLENQWVIVCDPSDGRAMKKTAIGSS